MVTQTGKELQTASPDQTSCMFGVPGMKTKNSHKQKKRRTMSWDEDHEDNDDDNHNDGDEPAGMSGALSSSRKGGGSSPIGTYKRKGKEARSRNNKGSGSSRGGIAHAYVKDVGKKGVKKRKQGYLDQSNSGFDVPLTKEEKKRRKEREVSAASLIYLI